MPAILLVGVSPEWLEAAAAEGIDIGSRNESTKIKESIGKMREDMKKFQNTVFEPCSLHPDRPADLEKFGELVQSRKWDAVSFGGGVRTIPKLTDYFTDLIATATRQQPGAKLLFPLLPEAVVPAINKYLPEAD